MRKLYVLCGTVVIILVLWMNRFEYFDSGLRRVDRINGELWFYDTYGRSGWFCPTREKKKEDAWNREHHLYEYAPHIDLSDLGPLSENKQGGENENRC